MSLYACSFVSPRSVFRDDVSRSAAMVRTLPGVWRLCSGYHACLTSRRWLELSKCGAVQVFVVEACYTCCSLRRLRMSPMLSLTAVFR